MVQLLDLLANIVNAHLSAVGICESFGLGAVNFAILQCMRFPSLSPVPPRPSTSHDAAFIDS